MMVRKQFRMVFPALPTTHRSGLIYAIREHFRAVPLGKHCLGCYRALMVKQTLTSGD